MTGIIKIKPCLLDIFTVATEEISNTKIIATVVDGKVVYKHVV